MDTYDIACQGLLDALEAAQKRGDEETERELREELNYAADMMALRGVT